MASMQAFIRRYRIGADVVMRGERNPDWSQPHNAWEVSLMRGRKRLMVPFYTGMALGEPEAADVLDSMASDAAGFENARSFEEWAGEYGYDTDSRKAERSYKAVEQQAAKLKGFLGDDLYKELLWHTERL